MRKAAEKILTREQVTVVCGERTRQGAVVGFTSGAFDLLHAGHVEFLEAARARCDLLVVALNSDASVRRYKGPDRPLICEDQRAAVLAALESVDYVFLFSERRNAANIDAIRPRYYFKAGDYETSELTSAPVIENHGGEAVLIPVRTQVSTTALVRRIGDAARGMEIGPEGEEALEAPPLRPAPAVFLDRDGTINAEVEYLHEPEQFVLLPGAAEGMRRFQDMGYRIVIVTTQAGIGLGYFTKEEFYRVNRAMFRALAPQGVKVDRIYYCPHGAGEGCTCRKPETALFERARTDLNLDLAHSVCIGDKTSDLEAGRRAGVGLNLLVRTGHAGRDGAFETAADGCFESILDAADWCLQHERD